MEKRWKQIIRVKGTSEQYNCNLKVVDLKKKNDLQYRIIIEGSDEVGSSKI